MYVDKLVCYGVKHVEFYLGRGWHDDFNDLHNGQNDAVVGRIYFVAGQEEVSSSLVERVEFIEVSSVVVYH